MKFWEVVISVLLVVLLENCVFAEGSSQAFLDYQAFCTHTSSRIFSNLPEFNKQYKAEVQVTLHKDGSYSDFVWIIKPEDTVIAKNIEEAVRKTAPFKGFDIGAKEYTTMKICFLADVKEEESIVTYFSDSPNLDNFKLDKAEPEVITLNPKDREIIDDFFFKNTNFKGKLNGNVTVELQKDGMIMNITHVYSSGNPEFDKKMVEAVRSAQPYFTNFESDTARFNYEFNTYGKLWDVYMENVKKVIYENWHPIRGKVSYSTTVQFKVARNGDISDCRVVKSSGDIDKDSNAIETVNRVGNLSKFPDGLTEQSIDIQFTFDYNVFDNDRNQVYPENTIKNEKFVSNKTNEPQTTYTSLSDITYGKTLEINVKNQLPCDIEKYMKYFRGSIAYWWNPTVEKVSRKTVVSLVLSKYGNVRKLEIIDKSGSEKFDKAVLRAINRAMPFKTLPPNYTAKTLNLELIFQSNAKNMVHSAAMQMLNTSHQPLKIQYEIPVKK